jgi:hypothetical protein
MPRKGVRSVTEAGKVAKMTQSALLLSHRLSRPFNGLPGDSRLSQDSSVRRHRLG